MKKTTVCFLLLSLLFGLWACKEDDHGGIYSGVYAEAEGRSYPMEDYFNGENYLELKKGGKAIMMINRRAHELRWKEKDGKLTFTEAGDPFYGELSEGVIVLDYMSWGLKLTFATEGAEVPETTVQNPEGYAEAMTAVDAYWTGDWYGWWMISEGNGAYASTTGVMGDVYGRIQTEKGRGPMELWELGEGKRPLGQCILRVDPEHGKPGVGIAMSGQGSFRGLEMSNGDWLIDPSLSAYENMLEISGYYFDEDGDYFYTLFLRPWGQLWEDVATAADLNTLPNGLPMNYDAYKEALAAGSSSEDFLELFPPNN